MGTSENHIRQWKHNREFLSKVPPGFPDWAVTAAFYVALHAVDSLLAHDRVTRINSHQSRNEVLANTNRYAAIQRAYLPLYDLSRTIRYLADPATWVPEEQVQKNVIGRCLYPIEASVQRLMGVDLKLAKIELAGGGKAPHSS